MFGAKKRKALSKYRAADRKITKWGGKLLLSKGRINPKSKTKFAKLLKRKRATKQRFDSMK
jgi:hypothetical protein